MRPADDLRRPAAGGFNLVPATRKQLEAGHAKGKFITKENAVKGAGIPFHAGAEKFYKEVGLLK